MKSLNSKRRRSFRDFFKDLDRHALFPGWLTHKEKREKWKEAQESIAIANIVKEIKSCICGKLPSIRWHWNLEYPEDVYIECECGMRTRGFVEFVQLNPKDKISKHYSKLKSVEKTVSIWNQGKE